MAALTPTMAGAVPLAVYGRLPGLEHVTISPDGSNVAFVKTANDLHAIAILRLADKKVLGVLNVGEAKLRALLWVDDDHIVVETSTSRYVPSLAGNNTRLTMARTYMGDVGGYVETPQLQLYSIAKQKAFALPDNEHNPNLLPTITGGFWIRRIQNHAVVFFQDFQRGYGPELVEYDVNSGEQKLHDLDPYSGGYLIDDAGAVVADEKYVDKDHKWTLRIQSGDDFKAALEGTDSIDLPSLAGFGPTGDTILVHIREDVDWNWRSLSRKDGTLLAVDDSLQGITAPIFGRLDSRMIGTVTVSDQTKIRFLDPAVQNRYQSVERAFDGARVTFVSASEDYKKLVVRVEGPAFGYAYNLIDFDTHKSARLGDVYDGLTEPFETRAIAYAAADGMQIPGYLTLPRGREAHGLPLVVLPHGGPEARDFADFDWWSQALADQGYAVLRPNYRGSDLGGKFLAAGYGEFGRKMLSDLVDGGTYLVKEGIVDPKRVCIVGASYGGYAALAGVTLTPGVFRCAVSVAGISDPRTLLDAGNSNVRNFDNTVQRYLDRYLGVEGHLDSRLDEISPIKHVSSVTVPVLLIHGQQDAVVPFAQSTAMFHALQDAKKDVKFVPLDNEDHWLSRGKTRLEMLQATVDFLRRNNPPD